MVKATRIFVSLVALTVLFAPTATAQWVSGGGNNIYTTSNVGIAINPASYGVPFALYSATLPFFIIDSGGSCGSCNPSFAFALSGVAKAYNGVAAAANGGVNGTVAGDLYIRANSGGKILFSIDSGTTAAITVNSSGTTLRGTVAADNLIAKYQDVAEWVPAAENLDAGTVVVIDPSHANRVAASTDAYDTRVAGVVSDKPGVILGEPSASKEMVATTGRVKVKVDAGYGAIRIGDLLVSSPVAGTAMLSKPVEVGGITMHRPGTIVGKALEPLESGNGEILVLLTLQ